MKRDVDDPNDRILVTEVVPAANDTSMQVVRNFHRALKAVNKTGSQGLENYAINEVSLEGYILGRFVIAVLERMGEELTRENFMEQALSSGPVAMDDWTLEFEPGTNTGSSYIRLIDLGGHDSTLREGETAIEKGG